MHLPTTIDLRNGTILVISEPHGTATIRSKGTQVLSCGDALCTIMVVNRNDMRIAVDGQTVATSNDSPEYAVIDIITSAK